MFLLCKNLHTYINFPILVAPCALLVHSYGGCNLNKTCFNLCHLELGMWKQLKSLYKGWKCHTARDSLWVLQFTWQGKGTTAFALYCVFWLWTKYKLSSKFICCTYLAITAWLSLGISNTHNHVTIFVIWSMEYCNNWSCWKCALYCRPQIVNGCYSKHAWQWKEQCYSIV